MSKASPAQILYSCSSPSRDTTIYLMGTFHHIPKDSFRLDMRLIDSLIDRSDIVFSEHFFNEDSLTYAASTKKMRQAMTYPEGQTLKTIVTKKEYNRIFSFYQSRYGIKRKQFERLSIYTPLLMHNKLAYENGRYVKMDDSIYQIALSRKKSLKNLDNGELLAAAYAQLNSVYGTAWLIDFVKGKDDFEERRKSLLDTYFAQDTSMLLKKTAADPVEGPIHAALLNDRNRSWIVTINQNLQKTNFVYCGWLHLIGGDFAILKVLKSRGYTIEPVYISSGK